MNILDIIPQGRDMAKTAHALAIEYYGLSSPATRRAIGKMVSELVARGEPICGSYGKPMGYYIPKTEEEAEPVYRTEVSRAKASLLRCARLAKALRQRFPDRFQISWIDTMPAGN